MIKVTDILSKPVISLLDSKTEGIVKNAVFDRGFKKLKYLILFDNNEHLEEKTLSINSIYSYGENAIVVKEENDLNLEISAKQISDKPFPINNSVYTYLGKFVGKVNDVILDEKFNIIALLVNNNEILLENIISSGLDAVIIQDDDKKVNIKNIKRKKNTKKIINQNIENYNNKVVILEENNLKIENNENATINKNLETNNSIQLNENEIEQIKDTDNLELPSISEKALNELNNEEKIIKYKLTDNPSLPKVMMTNYEFLIGRKLEKNIYSQNRELIARKNTKITKEIINKAKLYYKIREVIKYSHN